MSVAEVATARRSDPSGIVHRRGRVMGTAFHVVTTGTTDAAAIDQGVDRLSQLERRWSRFLQTSEISQINRAPDRFHLVSNETAQLIERSVIGWEITDGAFDPTVLQAVIDNGYDRPFAELDSRHGSVVHPAPAPGCHDVTVTTAAPDQYLVRLGTGVMFDPGGIGKGLAADIVVGELMAAGASGAMVNIGGDLVCRGSAPTSAGWVVEVIEPSVTDAVIATVALQHGAVATSTTRKRCWDVGDSARHHVVDPSTGRNSSGPVLATVVASDGWRAEVLATQLLVGAEVDRFDSAMGAALVVFADGTQRRLGPLGDFLC